MNHNHADHSPEKMELIVAEVKRVQTNSISVLETDWAMTLGSAPVAIVIIGRCILLSSTPNAVTLTLSDNKSSRKLESKYLRVNLVDIAQVGRSAFMDAEIGMAKISVLSQDLGRNLDNLSKLLRLPPSVTSAKFVEIQLKALGDKAIACEEEAKRIAGIFKAWRDKTDTLHLAVQEEAVGTQVALTKAETKLKFEREKVDKSKLAKDVAARELGFQQYKLGQAYATREHVGDELSGDAGVAMSAGIGIASTIHPLLGLSLAAITVFGIWAVDDKCETAEKKHEEKLRALKEAQLQEELARVEVEEFLKSGKSLDRIKDVLHLALGNLQELQNEIACLLLFFSNVVSFVDVLMNIYRGEFTEYMGALGSNEINDTAIMAVLEQMVQPVTTSIKCQFLVMHHVASAYHTISNKHIMPGFVEISSLGLTSTSLTEQDIDAKKTKLIKYQQENAPSVRAIAQDAQKALKLNIFSITQEAMQGLMISS